MKLGKSPLHIPFNFLKLEAMETRISYISWKNNFRTWVKEVYVHILYMIVRHAIRDSL